MRSGFFFLVALLIVVNGHSQNRDSSYFKKVAEPETSFITLKEGFKIFAQKHGRGDIKILFLHGGPGNTHEYFEIFRDRLSLDKYQLIWYDQLGSYYSDQPTDTSLLTVNRYLEEVEQVRAFYKLDKFYILGHSWGGLLAMEYALKNPDRLKGIIVSNKSYSQQRLVDTRTRLIMKVAEDSNASEQLLSDIKDTRIWVDTSVGARRLRSEFSRRHSLRMSPPLPDAYLRNARHVRGNAFGRQFAGRAEWNILDRLHLIRTPTLLIGAKNDYVSEEDLIEMNKRIKNSTLYIAPKGGHFTFWDDTDNYFAALEQFIKNVEQK